jgi:Xaa-Pro aminopeptidase
MVVMMQKSGRIIIDCSTVNSDLLYKVGVVIPDPFIYFQIEDMEGVIVKCLEYSRVKKFAKKNINVFLPEEISGSADLMSNKDVLKGLIDKYSINCFEVAENFPVVYADYLRKLGLTVKVIGGCFFPEREAKSPEEIINIREAAKVVESCMYRAESIIKESSVNDNNILIWNNEVLTSEILHKEINLEAVKHDAVAQDTIAASGKDSSQPHNAGSGSVKADVPIVVDIFPRMNKTGYWGDMTRTFVKGQAPEIVKKAYAAVKIAKNETKKIMKSGVDPAKVHNLAVEILDKHGFKTGNKDGEFYGFFHSLGHGVGLDIHEPPLVGARALKPLVLNSVVTVEPGVYYEKWGGVRLEDMVIVNENGIECITDYPENLEI